MVGTSKHYSLRKKGFVETWDSLNNLMELHDMSEVVKVLFPCICIWHKEHRMILAYYLLLVSQVKRTLGQFTPAQWDKDEWHPLLGPWRFIQVLSLCIVFLTVELNTFFLKFCLWIPPRNPVIVYRLILWWLIAIPTIREYNSYLQDRYYLSVFANIILDTWCQPELVCIFFLHITRRVLQKTSEKGGSVLLAFPCYLYYWTAHLYQVWTWLVLYSRSISSLLIAYCLTY